MCAYIDDLLARGRASAGEARPQLLDEGRTLGAASVPVNSMHHQGIKRLAPGLVPSAWAPDGLIEAFRHEGPGFMLAVQWHPEWKVAENPFYLSIFRAFGDACRERARRLRVAA